MGKNNINPKISSTGKSKGLFYCQYLTGLGHLTRSFILCDALAHEYDITFLQGGKVLEETLPHPHPFEIFPLPPLSVNTPTGILFDPQMNDSVENIFTMRSKIINHNTNVHFDFLVTDFFPFGIARPEFQNEIGQLLRKIKKNNPNCLIICSLRDVMTKMDESRQQNTLQYLEEFYDLALVHSDPRYFKLEDTWEFAPKIRDKLFYTGYVADPQKISLSTRKKIITVSLGGGAVGEKLAFEMIKITTYFPDYVFHFILGPECADKVIIELQKKSSFLFNVKIVKFVNNIETLFSESALSVSLGGYNTIVHLLKTKTPAIIFPYNFNREQKFRADRFAEFGLMKVVSEEELKTQTLKNIIQEEMKKTYPELIINLNGAAASVQLIQEALERNKK